MKKQIIKINESKLKQIVAKTVKKVLNEAVSAGDRYFGTGDGRKEYYTDRHIQQHANRKGVYGEITRHCQQTGVSYRDAMGQLYNLVKKYMSEGRFGNNEYVLTTIKAFNRLISNLYTTYISNVKRGYVAEAATANRHGVIYGDDKGQWMTDLKTMLQKYLANKYIHGKMSVGATEAFIEFLEVQNNPNAAMMAIRKMGKWLAMAGLLAAGIFGGSQMGNEATVQATQPARQEMSIQKDINVLAFRVHESQLSQESMRALQSLKPGNYTITFYNIANSNGKITREDQMLKQARYQQIQNVVKNLKNVNVEIKWGGMDKGQIQITPSGGNQAQLNYADYANQ